ncbi:hypothetical protein VTI74DRAFT_2215 [Chaetomium olivicolor]
MSMTERRKRHRRQHVHGVGPGLVWLGAGGPQTESGLEARATGPTTPPSGRMRPRIADLTGCFGEHGADVLHKEDAKTPSKCWKHGLPKSSAGR